MANEKGLFCLPKGSRVDVLVGGGSHYVAEADMWIRAVDARGAIVGMARRISREVGCHWREVDGQDLAKQMYELAD